MAEPSSELVGAFASSVRATRAELFGMTQAELAAEVAVWVPEFTYRKLRSKESGESRFYAHELLALSMVLGPVRTWAVPVEHRELWLKLQRSL